MLINVPLYNRSKYAVCENITNCTNSSVLFPHEFIKTFKNECKYISNQIIYWKISIHVQRLNSISIEYSDQNVVCEQIKIQIGL